MTTIKSGVATRLGVRRPASPEPTPEREPETLDWTRRQYELQVYDGGQRLFMVAWSDDGPMPRDGDFLILRNRERETRYRVDECRSTMSSGDVCTLRLTFAPRQAEEQT